MQTGTIGYAWPMQTPARMRILGLMSGTSCDGIDAAIVEVGAGRPRLAHFRSTPMPGELREPALRLAAPGLAEIDAMGGLDAALGAAFAEAALAAIGAAGLTPADIMAIGSHGQTIRHRPRGVDGGRPFSLQIGCASTIAERTGITTVADFRRRDLAAGGEGAPLVPFAHRLLFGERQADIAVVNIGGIANISYLGRDGSLTGFDTGPGNMVMDALMLALSDGRTAYDADGALAAAGRVDPALLADLMAHPFLSRTPPKSSGREDFGADFAARLLAADIDDAARLATACELTARSIAAAAAWLPHPPARWYIGGGGAANAHLMARLSALLAPAPVATTAAAGVPPEAVEAVSFAILARQALLGRPNTAAAVTGAAHDTVGGHIAPGANWPELLATLAAWTRSPTP
jgi:anhydro-N-acetylmuramic acid kinase